MLADDFSNMNGGKFGEHSSHQGGLSADGRFPNYAVRDASTAARIIEDLNSTFGPRISKVLVTFTPAFKAAIQGVTLNDGRKASEYIRNYPGHRDHFHWEVIDLDA